MASQYPPLIAARRPLPPRSRARYPGEFLALLASDHIALFRRLAEGGDVSRIRMGPQSLALLSHPDDIQRLLVTDQKAFVKGRALDRVKLLLGDGLLTNEGADHLRQRRLMQPAFHRDRIAAYGAVMAAYAQRTADAWRHSTVLDVHEAMMALTRDIAGKTLFDLDVGDDPGGVGEAIALSLRMYRWAVLPFGELSEYVPIPFVRRVQRARARLNAWLAATIQERRLERGDRGDLLSMLIRAGGEEGDSGGMTDRQLRDEVVTLFVAGHETTAVALSWTWYLLSQHPNVEARLHAELDGVLRGALPGAGDVPRLPYTRMVLAEAFRLYPPAWILERRAVSDVEFQGYRIPAGSLVFASQYLVHRDPRWYEQPDLFDPERWSPERAGARPKFSYFPFGGGTRVCIGEQFAWMEGTLILATIAQRWRLRHEPGHEVALEPLVTLRPKYGMRMMVTRRVGA
ncbi:MAG TPA: cytochrome P450 [Gemmatimonadaceae bacterium]|nr:cytochrome P450 [Gemmatimonadaceae bacterium]